jgi:phosphatidylglycerophosphate synthase
VNNSEPVRRTSEIEEVTNLYLIHPIASRLTPIFARLGVTPNAVSLAGMAFGILAGFAYYHYQDRRFVIAGFVLMIAWHVMDGIDGQLARLTNAQSQMGKILDGICDYVVFIAVYSGLGTALSHESGGWVWVLVIASGICHSTQSAAYELQRQEYNYWGWDRKSAELLAPDALPPAGAGPVAWVMALIYWLYVVGQLQMAGVAMEFRTKLAAILAAEPQRAADIRARYRATFAPSVFRWSIMSANYRTLAIFIAAMAGRPIYYFWFEIVGMSLITLLLIAGQRVRYRRFIAALEGVGRS